MSSSNRRYGYLVKPLAMTNCNLCGNPLKSAPGQNVMFHKECRKEGRRRIAIIKKGKRYH